MTTTMWDKIRDVLRAHRTVVGRADLARAIGAATLADVDTLNAKLADLIGWGDVTEIKVQAAGTGVDAPAFFEYHYTLTPKGLENARRRAKERAHDPRGVLGPYKP